MKIRLTLLFMASLFFSAFAQQAINWYDHLDRGKILQFDDFSRLLGSPEEYFPTNVGRTWTYDVILSSREDKALFHEIVYWPLGPTGQAIENRGVILNINGVSNPQLTLRVSAMEQGQLHNVKIAIIKDDLHIYGDEFDQAQLFWAIARPPYSSKFDVIQVKTYDRTSSRAPRGQWGMGPMPTADGYSRTCLFFDERPVVSKSIDKNNPDRMFILGFELSVNTQNAYLRFRRVIQAGRPLSPESRYMNNGFIEDFWYARGIGLVRLEQMVNGVKTMVWQLREFKF